MNATRTALLGSILLLGLLLALLLWRPKGAPIDAENSTLVVYCGAGVRAPVDAAAKGYERENRISIIFQYGPSQTLLAQAELTKTGDLLLPGDDLFLNLAREKGLIDESIPLAKMMPVLAVAKGNPKQISTLDDLMKPGVRLAQASPETAATGRLVQDAFQTTGDWERVRAHTTVFKATVSDVANDIRVGSVDAGFVWNVLLMQYPELESVPLPQLAETQALVSVGALKSSVNLPAAKRFMRYLAAKDKGLRLFEEHGFDPINGELWTEKP